ncbi:MAG: hypothetical protein H8D22_10730 [Candidatus Cloacimonetes bacterium]|nr:hypothetical protein [Candidatus Cloacimonadota bacterium]
MKSKILWFIVILLVVNIIILWIYIYIQFNKPIVIKYNEAEVEKAMGYHGILFCQLERNGNFYFFRDGYRINLLKTCKEKK